MKIFLGSMGLVAAMALHTHAIEPQLICEAPTYDFGYATCTQIVNHTFYMRNSGNATATITRVHSTCGCTTVQPTRKAVPPGETEPLEVRFNTKGRNGPQNRPIYVSWNSTNSQPLRLTLTGMVFNVIACSPALLKFGLVPATGVVQQVVRIYDPSSNSFFRITGVTIPHACFVPHLETITEGHDYRLTVKSNGPRQEGLMAVTAATITTDNPEQVVIRIPITLRVPGGKGTLEQAFRHNKPNPHITTTDAGLTAPEEIEAQDEE